MKILDLKSSLKTMNTSNSSLESSVSTKSGAHSSFLAIYDLKAAFSRIALADAWSLSSIHDLSGCDVRSQLY